MNAARAVLVVCDVHEGIKLAQWMEALGLVPTHAPSYPIETLDVMDEDPRVRGVRTHASSYQIHRNKGQAIGPPRPGEEFLHAQQNLVFDISCPKCPRRGGVRVSASGAVLDPIFRVLVAHGKEEISLHALRGRVGGK